MSSKHLKRHGRLPPFVPVLRATLDTPAWKATTYGARALYIALKRFLNENIGNNGKIYRSDREAAEDLGTGSPGSVVRWFRELEHYGFIVKTAEGCLGVDGDGTAPHWRLTECACDGNAPTRDFDKWDGVLFDPKKIESRDSKSHNPCPKESHTGNPTRLRKGSRCDEKSHIDSPPRCDEKSHITTYHSPADSSGLTEAEGRTTGTTASQRWPTSIQTTKVGQAGDSVEVVRDSERCYGFLRRWGEGWKAWWSGDRFDDHYIGEFPTKAAAIEHLAFVIPGDSLATFSSAVDGADAITARARRGERRGAA
jgi:hypothetical protein